MTAVNEQKNTMVVLGFFFFCFLTFGNSVFSVDRIEERSDTVHKNPREQNSMVHFSVRDADVCDNKNSLLCWRTPAAAGAGVDDG